MFLSGSVYENKITLDNGEKNKLKIMCGDAGNSFLNTPTDEKVHAVAGE